MDKRLVKSYEMPVGNVYRRRKETFETVDAFHDEIYETLLMCAHGHVIHTPQELGGYCVCQRPLCKDCATMRCELDGNLVCRQHAVTEGDRVLCANHNVIRLLAFSFFHI